MKHKIIYYTDPLNEEFSEQKITPKVIDKNWVYVHKGLFKKITHIFWLRIVIAPIFFLHSKLFYRHKIINKKILKPYKNSAIFMYGNHTHNLCDTYIPCFVNGYKDVYLICNPENVSIPVLGPITPSLGALPLPSDIESTRNFSRAIDYYVSKKKCIMIYPEAHIWPFYTKIRPFLDLSFRYPIKYDVPTFCITNTYQNRKISKRPKIVTYVDGPFFYDKNISKVEAKAKLRNEIYDTMCKRSLNSNIEIWKYIRKEDSSD